MRRIWVIFMLLLGGCAMAAEWEVFEHCTLEEKVYFDGDSFHVRTQKPGAQKSHVYVFRLYGVDCPETDLRFPERVAEQRRDFGRTLTDKEILMWGERARQFTRKFLAKPFTVHTRKQKAAGESRKNRYYAVIVGAGGERLDEALLKAGLARAHGMPAAWPGGGEEKEFARRLRALQTGAKRSQSGIWKHAK